MSINLVSQKSIQIGDIYMMKFDGSACEQSGYRPGIVFQNNVGNHFSPNIIALPLTSSLKNINQPTHVLIKSDNSGLPKDSMVICENPQRMSKEKIGKYITTLSDEYMAKIAEANLLATSAISFIDPDLIMIIWDKAAKLNRTCIA